MPSTSALSRPQLVAWRNAVFTIFVLSGLSIATWVSRTPAIRDELRTRLMAHAQKAYYAQKLGTHVGTLEKKVESLVDQFSDPEDIRY